jgi:hypothetical protein
MDYISDRDFGDETNNEEEDEPDIGVREPILPLKPLLSDAAKISLENIEELINAV